MKPVRIANEAVAGIDPTLLADGFGGLVRPVPVERRGGIAAYPHDAFLIMADLAAILVSERDLVTGHTQARRSRLLPVRTVAEIDVQRLGRAEPLHDLDE